MTKEQQKRIDRLTFDTYVDQHLNASAAAYQLGVSRQTVKRRVRRHSLSLSAAER